MSSFTNSWNESSPAGTDLMNTIDDAMRALKLDVRERISLEHQPMTSSAAKELATAAGRHLPGQCGVCFYGTTAQINALTTPPKGSLAWATDTNTMYLHTGSAWWAYSNPPARFAADKAGGADLVASGDVICDNELYDSASKYDVVTGRFTPGYATGCMVHLTGSILLATVGVTTLCNAIITKNDVLLYPGVCAISAGYTGGLCVSVSCSDWSDSDSDYYGLYAGATGSFLAVNHAQTRFSGHAIRL